MRGPPGTVLLVTGGTTEEPAILTTSRTCLRAQRRDRLRRCTWIQRLGNRTRSLPRRTARRTRAVRTLRLWRPTRTFAERIVTDFNERSSNVTTAP